MAEAPPGVAGAEVPRWVDARRGWCGWREPVTLVEEVRWPVGGGWARRARPELAIVVEGPALPERGFRGVLAPVVDAEMGGTRFAELGCRREGRGGSADIVPSFWRSRILRSRRLM